MKVVIVGAREDGHGKVVHEILSAEGSHEIVGFVDDDVDKHGHFVRDLPVIGGVDALSSLASSGECEGAVVAIGSNSIRRDLASRVIHAGLKLVNAIHPTVFLDSDVVLGRAVVLCQRVVIVTGTRVGDCVNIHTGATIDHDNRIADGANIGPGVHTAGRVKIGRDAVVGTGASLIPDVIVGEGAVVGAGAVVIGEVEPLTTVVGVPARIIRKSHTSR